MREVPNNKPVLRGLGRAGLPSRGSACSYCKFSRSAMEVNLEQIMVLTLYMFAELKYATGSSSNGLRQL